MAEPYIVYTDAELDEQDSANLFLCEDGEGREIAFTAYDAWNGRVKYRLPAIMIAHHDDVCWHTGRLENLRTKGTIDD